MNEATPAPRHSLCRACQADIVFLYTAAGKVIPVNADTIEVGDTLYEHGRHISHFATCPKADSFRRSK